MATHLGLDLQQPLLEGARVHPGQEAGEGRLAGRREGTVRAGPDSNGPALVRGQAPCQLDQVLLPAWSVAEHPQQDEGCQGLGGIGLGARAVVGHVLEVLGQGPELRLLVVGAGAGLLFHGGKGRPEVLGRGAEDQHGQPATGGIDGGIEHAFPDGLDPAEVMVFLQQGLEALLIGGLGQRQDPDVIQGDGAGLEGSGSTLHARESKKSGESCSAQTASPRQSELNPP